MFIYPIIIIIGGMLVLFMYITRIASNEIFSPSNKIHRQVGWVKDLSAPLYIPYILLSFEPFKAFVLSTIVARRALGTDHMTNSD
jgi:NADH:ubiquinone oxidoreductase subunit 6 (subunit J)